MAHATAENVPFHSIDAQTGEAFGPSLPVHGAQHVASACAAAQASFDAYRESSLEARALFLERIATQIAALGDDLIKMAMRESALARARLESERARTINQLRLFAQVVRRGDWMGLRVDPALPNRMPLARPDLRLRMIPLGCVAVFGASNFPLAFSTAGGDTASALAAGCPVVLRGHFAHPGTDAMVAAAIHAAAAASHLPSGVFSHLMGPEESLGAALVRDARIAAVAFTGSRRGGLAMVRLAQQREVPIPVYAEMSSINPVVLMPQALKARANMLGAAFVTSLTLGAGQFCTNPGLLLAIEGEGLATFIAAASTALANHDAATMLTRGIHAAYDQGVAMLARHPAVQTLAQGRTGSGFAQGRAAIFGCSAADFLANPALGQEVFGASSLLVRARDKQELRAVLASLEGQLTVTLQMDPGDEAQAAQLLPLLERTAGRIIANGWPTGVEVSHAMVHGGPYPATSDSRTTSVGSLAINRFLRPVAYQGLPSGVLPLPLRDDALSHLPRLVDGHYEMHEQG
jgi:alpha-ketoglutaric semialdehyde dehydrogenase